jgi:hypothetical protein
MMIRTTERSVYYPIPEKRTDALRGRWRARYVRGLLLDRKKAKR